MVTQAERVEVRRRHDWEIVLVYVVIGTVVLGLWRLSGDHDEPRSPWVRSAVAIGTDGSVDVRQRIAFSTPRSGLTVSIPERRSSAGQFGPRIDDLRVRVDGRAEAGLSRPLRVGETRTLTFPEPTGSVVLSYSVTGAIERTRPSSRGRALALVTPLSVDGLVGARSRLEIEQEGVLNLGCTAPGGLVEACGSDTGGRWVIARGAGDPVVDVVAQIDLPESGRG